MYACRFSWFVCKDNLCKCLFGWIVECLFGWVSGCMTRCMLGCMPGCVIARFLSVCMPGWLWMYGWLYCWMYVWMYVWMCVWMSGSGLYQVEKWWYATGMAGFGVYKFALRRLPGQAPPPWLTSEQVIIIIIWIFNSPLGQYRYCRTINCTSVANNNSMHRLK